MDQPTKRIECDPDASAIAFMEGTNWACLMLGQDDDGLKPVELMGMNLTLTALAYAHAVGAGQFTVPIRDIVSETTYTAIVMFEFEDDGWNFVGIEDSSHEHDTWCLKKIEEWLNERAHDLNRHPQSLLCIMESMFRSRVPGVTFHRVTSMLHANRHWHVAAVHNGIDQWGIVPSDD